MRVFTLKPVDKQIKKLQRDVKKKVQKQFRLLSQDFHHPSLHTKKMSGADLYEARIDIHYRFTFFIRGDSIFVVSVGMHDAALGKK